MSAADLPPGRATADKPSNQVDIHRDNGQQHHPDPRVDLKKRLVDAAHVAPAHDVLFVLVVHLQPDAADGRAQPPIQSGQVRVFGDDLHASPVLEISAPIQERFPETQ